MTFVYVWCSSLCECFHCAAGLAMSHSHVVEWIFGSRIQSHWPCRMLCPISMFSRILATERPTVPTTQAGGNIDTSRAARLPSSSVRWTSMTRRMYVASSSPRLSRTSWRMVSSSLPMISMSSAERWAIGFSGFFCRAVTVPAPLLGAVVRSVVDVAGAGGSADAGLDQDAVPRGGDGQLAVAQVAHGALPQRQHAAVADAHPAPAGHEDAGLLGGVEDRRGAVRLERGAGPREGDGAALSGHQDGRAEALGVDPVGDARRGPVVLQGLEHSHRPARPRGALDPVGHQVGDGGRVEHAGGVGVLLDQPDPPGSGQGAQFRTED